MSTKKINLTKESKQNAQWKVEMNKMKTVLLPAPFKRNSFSTFGWLWNVMRAFSFFNYVNE